ncbi:CobW family GTP-binding protein [Streptomyces marincola]|uniref:Cobalamin biosynthesis protein CobW n=1 Tax=Streptomyces marincola TaxID=2878388 RepID=A0A1W7CWL0_9ACTN|nr:GTP-binding protein [Streptomyces marincola]ARQ69116.1 cobalamin biosynthesis protein CobW [Streptomyces marincola]
MLPVVIVAGLHADARRAVVDALLRAVPRSVVLHHDLSTASEGAVLRVVRDPSHVVSVDEAPLVNDCACCALREDLLPELERLADSGELCALAVVELWDSVEPQAMAQLIDSQAGDGVTLVGVVTAVDPARLLPSLAQGDDLADVGLAAASTDRRTVSDTFARQLEYAPVLALVDGGTAPDATDRALLVHLHGTATLTAPTHPDFLRVVTAGFDAASAAARVHPATALLPQAGEHDGVTTHVWRARRPFHAHRLYSALPDLACAAVRSRGRFWVADRTDAMLAWDAAGGALCVDDMGPWFAALPEEIRSSLPVERQVAAQIDWHPEHGDRGQHLVFVAPGLDTGWLTDLLDSCLLTDEEYAAGPLVWATQRSGFDQLLAVS